jgi:hypothetical protein
MINVIGKATGTRMVDGDGRAQTIEPIRKKIIVPPVQEGIPGQYIVQSNSDCPNINNPTITTKRKYGRLPSTDLKDHDYLAKRLLPRKLSDRKTRTWWDRTPWDQGNTSQCVAFSSLKYLEAGPTRNVQADPEDCPLFYKACQQNDEWDGEDYDGTSVRAAFKVLKDRGFISEYNWAFDVQTCVEWMLEVGPMVFGTIWTYDMDTPDSKGFIHVTGDIAGGHAYLGIGVNKTKVCPDGSKGAFRLLNSWGPSWGDKGRAWVSFKDMAILLAEYGEACTAKEILVDKMLDINP